MTKLESSGEKNFSIREKIDKLYRKAQDHVYNEILLMGVDKNRRFSLYDQAIELLDEAIKLNPNLVKTYNLKAYIYSISGRSEMALRPLEMIMRLDPDNKRAVEFHEALSYDLQIISNGNN